MKTKSFRDYLEKRLNKKEIAQIEEQAEREIKIFKSLNRLFYEIKIHADA